MGVTFNALQERLDLRIISLLSFCIITYQKAEEKGGAVDNAIDLML